jgi:ribose-phosphate pyrophosphokinase
VSIKFQAKTQEGFTVDSPLQPFVFPDGAAHVKGADAETRYQYQIADVRGLDHTDLFILSMWADACDERNEKKVLILPYLPGARMDRGVPFGSRIYAWYIEKCVAPDQIITIDPHSEEALYDWRYQRLCETTVFPVERIIRKEVQDPTRDFGPHGYVGVIAPDAGAVDRATRAAHAMSVPVYRAEKKRDFATGKLSGFGMVDELPAEGRLLVVDDIGDGMGTFKGLADIIGLGPDRLDLWVTHLILSKGEDGLRERFGIIHTTDSFWANESSDFIKVHRLTRYLYPEISVQP